MEGPVWRACVRARDQLGEWRAGERSYIPSFPPGDSAGLVPSPWRWGECVRECEGVCVCVWGGRLRPFIINVHRGVLTSSEPAQLTAWPAIQRRGSGGVWCVGERGGRDKEREVSLREREREQASRNVRLNFTVHLNQKNNNVHQMQMFSREERGGFRVWLQVLRRWSEARVERFRWWGWLSPRAGVCGLVSRPVTLGKSWNLITASQTLSRADLLTLVASRHAPPPHPNAPAQAGPFAARSPLSSNGITGSDAARLLGGCLKMWLTERTQA